MSIPARSLRIVLDRSNGLCEVCGQPGTNTHHRRARGAGGTKDPAANLPANLLRLCGSGTTGCHGLIESRRSTSYGHGHLVPQGKDPSRVPVWLVAHGWVLLDNDGGSEPCDSPWPDPGSAA